MKALTKTGPRTINGSYRFIDVAEPVCGPDDVIMEVKAAAICGSDMKHYQVENGTEEFGSIRGHEFAGQITEVGENVTDWHVGQRIVSDNTGHVCGKCTACMSGDFLLCPERLNLGTGYPTSGGFTKYCRIPGEILKIHPQAIWEIPEEVSYEEAAVLDPICNAYKAVAQESNLLPGENIVIFGAGTLGLLCVQMAKIMGALNIVMVAREVDTKVRVPVAMQLGATHFVNSTTEDVVSRCHEICGGPDSIGLIVDCTGAPESLKLGLDILRNNGQFMRVGMSVKPLNFDINAISKRNLDIHGHQAYNSISWKNGIQLLKSGKIQIKPLITHRFGLSEWEKGFAAISNKEAIKVILTYDCD